jgi:hypothetical protein
MMSTRQWFRTWGLALATMICPAANGRGADYQVGVGRVEITPHEPIWMAGYAARKHPSEGIDQPLYLKALALQAGEGPPFVLITADIIGFPRSLTEKIAGGLKERFQLPRENVLAIGSHTHTGPVLRDRLEGMYGLEGKNLETVNAYTDQLPGRALEAVDAALKSMKPARLSLGRARATFAMNRRVFRRGGVTFGANPDGPVNHEVSVLRLDNPDGSLRAVVFGYCCHCTTLRGDYYRINGDWAGYAQDFLERAHPGAMAFFRHRLRGRCRSATERHARVGPRSWPGDGRGGQPGPDGATRADHGQPDSRF